MKRWLKGQAMAEYVIVCAGLMMSLLAIGNADCGGDGNTTTCASRLLTVLHDNYDGYSSSISGVQQYGEYAARGAYDSDPNSGGGGGSDDGTGGGVVGGLNPDGLTDINQITSDDGFATFGNLQSDGTVLDATGEIIGFYSDVDNTFTDNNGNTVAAGNRNLVLDEEGNVLHMQAVTSCVGLPSPYPRPVYSWAYVSLATDKVFNTLNKNEMDIGDKCPQASFKVVKNGQDQGGRILNSEYYAAVFTVNVSETPLPKTGDVVYWTDLRICSVMAPQWDADIDPDDELDDDEKYAARLALFNDPDRNLGQLDIVDYFTQVGTDPSKSQPNDCPTVNIISQPS
jgi:hypothetical protein